MDSLQSQAATLQRRGALSELAEGGAGSAHASPARGNSEPSPETFVIATPSPNLGSDDALAKAMAKLEVMNGFLGTSLENVLNGCMP